MPKIRAVSAELMAMSANSVAVGLGLTAQSPNTSTRSFRHMRKTEDTMDAPGLVLMNSKEGRMVWAVVLMEPETMPSASPLCTIMVPKKLGSSMMSLACSRLMPLRLRSS